MLFFQFALMLLSLRLAAGALKNDRVPQAAQQDAEQQKERATAPTRERSLGSNSRVVNALALEPSSAAQRAPFLGPRDEENEEEPLRLVRVILLDWDEAGDDDAEDHAGAAQEHNGRSCFAEDNLPHALGTGPSSPPGTTTPGVGAGVLEAATAPSPRLSSTAPQGPARPPCLFHSAGPHIHKVVLTGGPCGGKTTAMDLLTQYLKERGVRVFTVPELATLFFRNGVSPEKDLEDSTALIEFQANLLRAQIHLEDTMASVAAAAVTRCQGRDGGGQHEKEPRAVLLCDRGALDGKAYVSEEHWREILDTVRAAPASLLQRYDLVCHLVTAADGAEEFYGTATNETRSEDVPAAQSQDGLTREVWREHPNIAVFGNEGGSFETKIQNLVERVWSHVVGRG